MDGPYASSVYCAIVSNVSLWIVQLYSHSEIVVTLNFYVGCPLPVKQLYIFKQR